MESWVDIPTISNLNCDAMLQNRQTFLNMNYEDTYDSAISKAKSQRCLLQLKMINDKWLIEKI